MPGANFRQWNDAIRRRTAEGRHADALDTFLEMRRHSLRPSALSLSSAIKSSSLLPPLSSNPSLPASIHAFLSKTPLSGSPPVSKSLMHAYLALGLFPESLKLFSLLPFLSLDSAACNILLAGFSNLGLLPHLQSLFSSMLSLSSFAKPNSISLTILLAFSAKTRNFLSGKLLHSYAVKSNLESETLVGNSLLSMYSKSGLIPAQIFHQISPKDAISFNSMISCYLHSGQTVKSFNLLREMAKSTNPNEATLVTLLPACNSKLWGKEIHAHASKSSLSERTSVGNSLMAFYCRVSELAAAEKVFRRLSSPDVVSFNTMISGAAINGHHRRSLELFRDLRYPDKITLVSVLPVLAHLGRILEGKIIHAMAVVSQDLERETDLKNALISFYVKTGRLDDALSVFTQIEKKDLVSWNSILAGLSGNKEELLAAARAMQVAGFRPDAITILSLLHAGLAREIHGFSLREGFLGRDDVASSLADTYSRLGFVEYAVRLCRSLDFRVSGRGTVISIFMRHGMIHDAEKIFDHDGDDGRDDDEWMMMIHGYARNGLPHQAIAMFVDFGQRRVPGGAAVTSVLSACARLASIELVRQCHAFSLRVDFLSDPHLAAALVDSYCKCGGVDSARKVFSMIGGKVKDVVCYTAMAAGYAINGMTSEALTLFREMAAEGIQADHVSTTAMLSACSHAGLFREGVDFFLKVKNAGPTEEQYGCVVDLFARGGMLTEAVDFARAVPEKVNAGAWGALLGGCKVNGEVAVGRMAAERLFHLERENVGNYVVMSNVYAAAGEWEEVEKVRGMVKAREMKKPPGCSWIEVGKSTHVFVAGDLCHPDRTRVFRTLKILNLQIKEPPPSVDDTLLTSFG